MSEQLEAAVVELDLKNAILRIVEDSQGCKGIELVTQLAVLHQELNATITDTFDMLTRMVRDGDLVEVEYILPNLNYKIKSIYFPRGTKVSTVLHG